MARAGSPCVSAARASSSEDALWADSCDARVGGAAEGAGVALAAGAGRVAPVAVAVITGATGAGGARRST